MSSLTETSLTGLLASSDEVPLLAAALLACLEGAFFTKVPSAFSLLLGADWSAWPSSLVSFRFFTILASPAYKEWCISFAIMTLMDKLTAMDMPACLCCACFSAVKAGLSYNGDDFFLFKSRSLSSGSDTVLRLGARCSSPASTFSPVISFATTFSGVDSCSAPLA